MRTHCITRMSVIQYLNEVAASNNAVQIIVYDGDSVEVEFKDGSSLQLSACGSCYQYMPPSSGFSVVSESEMTRRRSCFATSETKTKVDFSIFWRNHFSQRPYLPSFLHYMYKEKTLMYKDITSYTWLDVSNNSNCENENFTQDIVIPAKDDLASLTICKSGYMCKVENLVKISSAIKSSAYRESKSDSEEKKSSRNYISLKQVFCLSTCPTFCRYPVSVALKSVKLVRDEFNTDIFDSSQYIDSCHAPQPLPNVCNKQFSHAWRLSHGKNVDGLYLPECSSKQQGNTNIKLIKAVWNSNVLYWIFKSPSLKNKIALEAWLPDETVVLSNSTSNLFFTHFTFDGQNKSKLSSKRVYSPTCLPMDSSLKIVILRAIHLRSYGEQVWSECQNNGNLKHCWQENIYGFGNLVIDSNYKANNNLDNLNESVIIPRLGKFSALRSSIQIVYEDKTTLYIALNQSNLNSLQSSSDSLSEISCRMLFSNGKYMECSSLTQTDSHLCFYLNSACDWLLWLAKPKSERLATPFYSDTIFSSEKLDMVSFELEKINRFNFLIENDSLSSVASNESSKNSGDKVASELSGENLILQEDSLSVNDEKSSFHHFIAPFDVSNVLKNTTHAISDLDDFIKTMRSSNA